MRRYGTVCTRSHTIMEGCWGSSSPVQRSPALAVSSLRLRASIEMCRLFPENCGRTNQLRR